MYDNVSSPLNNFTTFLFFKHKYWSDLYSRLFSDTSYSDAISKPLRKLSSYLQQRQLATDEKSTYSPYKNAKLHRPTFLWYGLHTAILKSPVYELGTKRPLFPFHLSIYQYNH